MNHKQQIISILTEKREQMTVVDIARQIGVEVESVRSAIKRLYASGEIHRRAEQHEYTVGTSVARHIRYRYFVA